MKINSIEVEKMSFKVGAQRWKHEIYQTYFVSEDSQNIQKIPRPFEPSSRLIFANVLDG